MKLLGEFVIDTLPTTMIRLEILRVDTRKLCSAIIVLKNGCRQSPRTYDLETVGSVYSRYERRDLYTS